MPVLTTGFERRVVQAKVMKPKFCDRKSLVHKQSITQQLPKLQASPSPGGTNGQRSALCMAATSGLSDITAAAATSKEVNATNNDILPLTLEKRLENLMDTIIADHQLAAHDEPRRDHAAEFTRQVLH